MPSRCRTLLAVVVAALVLPVASGYMEYQPATMAKLCKSPRIRLLKVTKFDKESGVVLFELVENLNTPDDKVKSEMADKIPTTDADTVRAFKHSVPPDKDGQAVWEWVGKGKTAVMFTLENGGQEVSARACGYVFVDDLCFSVVYNKAGDYWAFIRGEPLMSKCYSGKAESLPKIVKDVLAGREVKVPTKEPAADVEFKERSKQVFDALNKNR